MPNVPLKPAEIQYLSDCVRYDLGKTEDPAEAKRLHELFIILSTVLTLEGEVQA